MNITHFQQVLEQDVVRRTKIMEDLAEFELIAGQQLHQFVMLEIQIVNIVE